MIRNDTTTACRYLHSTSAFIACHYRQARLAVAGGEEGQLGMRGSSGNGREYNSRLWFGILVDRLSDSWHGPRPLRLNIVSCAATQTAETLQTTLVGSHIQGRGPRRSYNILFVTRLWIYVWWSLCPHFHDVAFAINSSDHPFAGTIGCLVAGMNFSFSSSQTKASNEAKTEGGIDALEQQCGAADGQGKQETRKGIGIKAQCSPSSKDQGRDHRDQ